MDFKTVLRFLLERLILFALYTAIFTAITYCIKYIQKKNTDLQNILFDSAIIALFFSIVIGNIFKNKRVIIGQAQVELLSKETKIIEEASPTFFQKKAWFYGKLVLTEKTILFKSQKNSYYPVNERIPLEQIKEVTKTKSLGIFNDSIKIVTFDNHDLEFVVGNQRKWIERIHELH